MDTKMFLKKKQRSRSSGEEILKDHIVGNQEFKGTK